MSMVYRPEQNWDPHFWGMHRDFCREYDQWYHCLGSCWEVWGKAGLLWSGFVGEESSRDSMRYKHHQTRSKIINWQHWAKIRVGSRTVWGISSVTRPVHFEAEDSIHTCHMARSECKFMSNIGRTCHSYQGLSRLGQMFSPFVWMLISNSYIEKWVICM